MTISWPAYLPQVVPTGGYEERPPVTVLRSDMDAGPAKVRQRFTSGVRPIALQLILTDAQADALDYFYRVEVAGGSIPFRWRNPRTNNPASVRFADTPSMVVAGLHWRASVQLEVLP
jgi:hypothetical protein